MKQVICISSIAGYSTPFPAPIYNATKHGINGFVRTLAPMDKRLGIRVTCVAPGIIKTPLWLEHPDKMRLLSPEDEWVTPEAVADVMGTLVSEKEMEVEAVGAENGKRTVEIEGGMIVEVAKGRRRVVTQYNDPGPINYEGTTVGRMGEEAEGLLQRLEKDGL